MNPHTLLLVISLIVVVSESRLGGLVDAQAYHYSQGWYPGRKRSVGTTSSSSSSRLGGYSYMNTEPDKLSWGELQAVKLALRDAYEKSEDDERKTTSLLASATQLISRIIKIEVERRIRDIVKTAEQRLAERRSNQAQIIAWLQNEGKDNVEAEDLIDEK